MLKVLKRDASHIERCLQMLRKKVFRKSLPWNSPTGRKGMDIQIALCVPLDSVPGCSFLCDASSNFMK